MSLLRKPTSETEFDLEDLTISLSDYPLSNHSIVDDIQHLMGDLYYQCNDSTCRCKIEIIVGFLMGFILGSVLARLTSGYAANAHHSRQDQTDDEGLGTSTEEGENADDDDDDYSSSSEEATDYGASTDEDDDDEDASEWGNEVCLD
ncbi:hypothetical protein Hz2V005 [Helicoverpa zea nudivirus 2]|uniref:Uncharacterized protein n=1 Tax=Helicoverpa zea nudivirus 2 TaxID=1128424 RepID=G9I031_HZNV2|nr:orf5 gene product [Helicoverpa zea nudivirus 2]AEW69554.1 hypothetical protein Hz2V005 [Helicoverpa zea nudivirus 2]